MGAFGIGPWELVLVFIVALIVFGPGKLPEIGATVGRGIREFRRYSAELTSELTREIEAANLPQSPAMAPAERGPVQPAPQIEPPAAPPSNWEEPTMAVEAPQPPLETAEAGGSSTSATPAPSPETDQPPGAAAPARSRRRRKPAAAAPSVGDLDGVASLPSEASIARASASEAAGAVKMPGPELPVPGPEEIAPPPPVRTSRRSNRAINGAVGVPKPASRPDGEEADHS